MSFVTISYGPWDHTPRAEATFPTIDYANIVQTTISAIANVASRAYNAITSWATNSLAMKEFQLDAIAWELINLILEQMTRDIVAWINSGFEGSPAFITDFDAFMLDVADIQAGKFITRLGLGMMCSPFKLNIQLSLVLRYQAARKYESQCRLSDVVTNMENFLNGDFSQGGWGGWLNLTMIPDNNPHGGMVEAEYAMLVGLSNAQGEARTESLFGNGFMTYKSCETVIDPVDGDAIESCTNLTPGKVIENQLNDALGIPRERLTVADEINEILGALFNQLVIQTFRGAGGLLGLTSSGYNPQGFSYVEAMAQPDQPSAGGLQTDQLGVFDQAIDTENRYITAEQQIVAIVNSAEQYLANSCAAGLMAFPANLSNYRTSAQQEIAAAQGNITTIQSFAVQYDDEPDPNQRLVIFQTFLNMQNNGTFHTEVEVATLEAVTVGEVSRAASDFRSQVNNYDCPSGSSSGGSDSGSSSGDDGGAD